MVEDFSAAGALNAFFFFLQTQFSGKRRTSEGSLCVVTAHHMSSCVTLFSHPAPYALTEGGKKASFAAWEHCISLGRSNGRRAQRGEEGMRKLGRPFCKLINTDNSL